MRAYWAILSARFRMLLQYRAAALAGLATQLFWGGIRIMILVAFMESGTGTAPMDVAMVITYVWIGQGFLRLVPMWADHEVAAMIRSGTVAYEICRPVDLYWYWYTRSLATITAPTFLRAIPLFLFAAGVLRIFEATQFYAMSGPASWLSGLVFGVAQTGAVFLSASIMTLLTISLLWTISGDGICRLLSACCWLLGGIIIPIPFFPEWLQPILNALPFRGIMDTPIRLYVGHIPPSEALGVIAHQWAWILGLILIGRLALARGTRRLVVQGG